MTSVTGSLDITSIHARQHYGRPLGLQSISFHNFDFAPGKDFVQKNHTGGDCVRPCSEPGTNQDPSRGGRNLFQRPSSPRPSPPGEGESFAVFLKIRATEFAGRLSAKSETCDCYSFSPGEKVRLRAVVKHHFHFAYPAPEQAKA
jgi:hypothetical protein